MFYFSLANISPRFRSKLKTVQLLAICKQRFIKRYGMNAILCPIVNDIKELVGDIIVVYQFCSFMCVL